MNIGEAAQASGLPSKTIRYYEDIGLVKPARASNGYRDYAEQDVHMLRFLQRARSLGFSVEDCRQLLSLYEDKGRASAHVKSIAGLHLEQIEQKIAELQSMKQTLEKLVAACRGDNLPECPILADLAESHTGRRRK